MTKAILTHPFSRETADRCMQPWILRWVGRSLSSAAQVLRELLSSCFVTRGEQLLFGSFLCNVVLTCLRIYMVRLLCKDREDVSFRCCEFLTVALVVVRSGEGNGQSIQLRVPAVTLFKRKESAQ